jgi:hypothetical protein
MHVEIRLGGLTDTCNTGIPGPQHLRRASRKSFSFEKSDGAAGCLRLKRRWRNGIFKQRNGIYKQLHSCHDGDDIDGSGEWYTEAEAKAYATEMKDCVGFTFDLFRRGRPSDKDGVAWFHRKVLESDIEKKHERKQHLYVIVNCCDDDTREAIAMRREQAPSD